MAEEGLQNTAMTLARASSVANKGIGRGEFSCVSMFFLLNFIDWVVVNAPTIIGKC
jgi:hypothetical protein